jgi:hypothetical protein
VRFPVINYRGESKRFGASSQKASDSPRVPSLFVRVSLAEEGI